MNGGGAEREGDTESKTGSRLRAISPEPDAGLELTDGEIVTWLKSDAQPTAPPRRPLSEIIFKIFFFFNVYLFLGQRETEHEQGRGRERGRHRIENRLQALSHQPRVTVYISLSVESPRNLPTRSTRIFNFSATRPLVYAQKNFKRWV